MKRRTSHKAVIKEIINYILNRLHSILLFTSSSHSSWPGNTFPRLLIYDHLLSARIYWLMLPEGQNSVTITSPSAFDSWHHHHCELLQAQYNSVVHPSPVIKMMSHQVSTQLMTSFWSRHAFPGTSFLQFINILFLSYLLKDAPSFVPQH